MKKNKLVSTWPLSILVIVASFLSILVVYQRVVAVWVEPTYQPNDTTILNNFVFTPMTQDLDLGSHAINATGGAVNLNDDVDVSGNLNVDGSLTVGGVPVSGSGTQLWQENGTNIFYSAGNVGVGTNAPSHSLHVLSTSQNAEIDLQTGGAGGDNSHWGIYHDSASNDLRFWKGGADRVTFADTGEIGINTAPSASYQLNVNGDTKTGVYSQVSALNIIALHGKNNHLEFSAGGGEQAVGVRAEAMSNFFIGGTGLYATGNIGVKAVGNQYGIKASASGGNAIYATGYSGGPSTLLIEANGASLAADFRGNVAINSGALTVTNGISFAGGARSVGIGSYFYINSGSGLPTLGCDGNVYLSNRGAVYLDYSNSRFYVCNGAGGWKYTTLQ